jgi:hypothetical protein
VIDRSWFRAPERSQRQTSTVTTPAVWGVIFGGLQAASPLAFWWLDTSTVYALGLVLIASIYIGFAVADGRPAIIAVASTVAGVIRNELAAVLPEILEAVARQASGLPRR